MLTCCKLGVVEVIVDAIWSGVVLGDSSDDEDEQFDWELLSYCCWINEFSNLHAITEVSLSRLLKLPPFDDDTVGMDWFCDVADVYEYSNGFVIAMSELRISGVLGVLEQKSTPTPSNGVDNEVLKLYIFVLFWSFKFKNNNKCF